MKLVLIILKLLLTPYFVNTSGIEFADANSTYCQNRLCIQKCCPENFYVKRNECVPYPKNDFKITLPVYDNDLKPTGMMVQDVFVFNANAFGNAAFNEHSSDVSISGLDAYITDRGILYLRSENETDQWRYLASEDYCLDLYSKRKRSTAHIWVNTQKAFTRPVNVYGHTTEYTTEHTTKHTTRHTTEHTAEHTLEYTTEAEYTTKYKYYRITTVEKISGTIISCVFLSIVLMVYSVLMPESTKFGNWVLMAYDLSLLLAFIFLITLQTVTPTVDSCIILTCAVYFFYLTSFCWMNIMSFDIWWTFRGYLKARPIRQRDERLKFAKCCLYALSLPLLMTIGLFVVSKFNLRHTPWFIPPEIPQSGCFLTAAAKLVYLNMPMLILTLVSWVLLVMAGIDVWRLGKGLAAINSELTGSPVARRMQFLRLLLYLKLSILMTLNWIVELLSILVMGIPEDVITDKLYLFLGFGIFVVLVCKKEIFMKLTARFRNSKSNPKAETLVTKSVA